MPAFEKAIWCAIVRILAPDTGPDRRVCGAGFLIAPRRLLTCAHVVSTALQCQEPDERKRRLILLDFPFLNAREPLHASIVHVDPSPQHDLAVLELFDPAPAEAQPVPLKRLDTFWDHPYRVLGFSDQSGEGVWAEGHLQGADRTGAIQMASDSGSEHIIREGFSGAPVWDEAEEAVVGMVGEVIWWGSRASRPLMLPLRSLCQSWPELLTYLIREPSTPVATPRTPADPFAEQEWQAGQLVRIAGRQYLLREPVPEAASPDPPDLERWYLARPFPPEWPGRSRRIEQVLIKQIVLRPPMAQGTRLLQHLRDESELLMRLPGRTIFPVCLATEAGAQSFTLVQRYPPGRPLSRCFPEQAGPIDPFSARQLLRALPPFCRQLMELHQRGHAHRWLCGASLILEQPSLHGTPVLRLRDLGLATRPPRAGEGPQGYAAPEQLYARYSTPGTDLYQLGALLYHLLTGKLPGSFMYGLAPPSSLQPGLPPALDSVIMRALEREPAQRWPDLVTFAKALNGVLQDWSRE
ncbi:MAG: trypsin-like peptidase domain-containing protein [Thermogemmatispora sp.]|uniref:trypsin-like peptidase domain-containing protein n=1 Tax=Thermogemmatispora sp. TaxID=1968838 RepID=UPI00261A746A|nr:trypsin-like peptidase domain-containing protein [Thermogemmatispora sp.]MBX5457366.1 trypsin-like peptidase domain-containing protein [Thermogemmatispora sp.]